MFQRRSSSGRWARKTRGDSRSMTWRISCVGKKRPSWPTLMPRQGSQSVPGPLQQKGSRVPGEQGGKDPQRRWGKSAPSVQGLPAGKAEAAGKAQGKGEFLLERRTPAQRYVDDDTLQRQRNRPGKKARAQRQQAVSEAAQRVPPANRAAHPGWGYEVGGMARHAAW